MEAQIKDAPHPRFEVEVIRELSHDIVYAMRTSPTPPSDGYFSRCKIDADERYFHSILKLNEIVITDRKPPLECLRG
jgi:hypothetical protein